jgi:beta-lactamase class A
MRPPNGGGPDRSLSPSSPRNSCYSLCRPNRNDDLAWLPNLCYILEVVSDSKGPDLLKRWTTALMNVLLLLVAPWPAVSQANGSNLERLLSITELESGGRIGVAALDTASGSLFGYRSDERFAMCSTFKLLLSSAVLSRVDNSSENLDREVPIAQDDLVPWAPFIEERLDARARSVTIRELCVAVMVISDNSAANILLREIGGTSALNRYVRSLGDSVTRLDHFEPHLNTNVPADPTDSTTPNAFLDTMRQVLVGDVLSRQSRNLLLDWLTQSVTGTNRLRGEFDPRWRSGNKSGSGNNATANDVAIVWPDHDDRPIIIAAFYAGSSLDTAGRDDVLATVGSAIVRHFGRD